MYEFYQAFHRASYTLRCSYTSWAISFQSAISIQFDSVICVVELRANKCTNSCDLNYETNNRTERIKLLVFLASRVPPQE